MESKIYDPPESIKTGTGEALFDYIAESMAEFIAEQGVKDQMLPLGFTFSFPLVQVGSGPLLACQNSLDALKMFHFEGQTHQRNHGEVE